MTKSRNKSEGIYQGAVKRYGGVFGDLRPNHQGSQIGKRHIRSNVQPKEPLCNFYRDAKPVSVGAALNVWNHRVTTARARKGVIPTGPQDFELE